MQRILKKKEISNIASWIKEKYVSSLKKSLAYEFVFDCRLVGSAAKNLVVTDANGYFDLDFQIILSHNSPVSCDNSAYIKNKFFDCIRKINVNTENSTTAITVNGFTYDNELIFSVDFVIMRYANTPTEIIKRNISGKNTNEYTWCQLPSRYALFYEKLDGLSTEDKNKLRTYIMEDKMKEKRNRNSLMSGFELFLNVINNRVKDGKVK